MSIRRRRNRYKFTEKVHSKKGILSMCIAIALILEFILFIYLAFANAGNFSAYYGSAGVLSIILTIVAFIIAVQSMYEEDSFKLFPGLGCFFSVIAFLIWTGTYIMGFMSL